MHDMAQAFLGALLFGILAGVAVWTSWRILRRRWLRRRGGWVGLAALGASTLSRMVRWAVGHPVTSAGWWTVQRDRQRLGAAVSSACRTVERAQAAGVPTGDLPSLCRQLRRAADHLDHCMALESTTRGTQVPSRRRQDLETLIASSVEIRETALSALETHASAPVPSLAHAVHQETQAVREGLGRIPRDSAGTLV